MPGADGLRAGLCAALVVTAISHASTADAGGEPRDEAEVLFEQGRQLFDRRHFVDACEALAASARIEARVGTLGLLAACHNEVGKVASAAREYARAAELAHATADARETYARSCASALERVAPRIRVKLTDPSPAQQIWIGGELVTLDADSTALVDPGPIEISVRAPGRREARFHVDVARGQLADVEVPALEPVPAVASVPPSFTSHPPAPLAQSPDAESGWRALGVGGVVVGATSLATGVAFGIAAIADKSASSPFCDANDHCQPRGGAYRDLAARDAAISTATLAAGAVTLGAGVIVLVSSHRRGESRPALGVTPSIGPNGARAALHGSF